MPVKVKNLDELAIQHLTRKQSVYQGHYAAMRNQYGSDEADQAVRKAAESLEIMGIKINKFPHPNLPRCWHEIRR